MKDRIKDAIDTACDVLESILPENAKFFITIVGEEESGLRMLARTDLKEEHLEQVLEMQLARLKADK